MTTLFIAALNPVQSLIGATRRSRDLFYSSQMLSRIASLLAQDLADIPNAVLVFPADPLAGSGTTNKIVALLPDEAVPSEVSRQLGRSLRQRLAELGEACLERLQEEKLDEAVAIEDFRKQMEGALRLFSAWAQFTASQAAGYATAWRSAHDALESRKQTRDFVPNPTPAPGSMLSSLDGREVSVLADRLRLVAGAGLDPGSARAISRLRRRYGIDATEQLDALGLLKRVMGTEAGFPAVTRIALQPWVQAWSDADRADLEALLEPLGAHGHARRNTCRSPHPMAVFPFDSEVLLPGRLSLALQDSEQTGSASGAEGLRALGRHLETAPRYGLPGAGDALGIALIEADGDHMGKILSDPGVLQADTHRAVATALQAFAGSVEAIVHSHGGCLLYAGGDDVLALLPVAGALGCATDLRAAYERALCAVVPAGALYQPTLSVGVAFAHVLGMMGDLRALAHQALVLAKEGLDLLGLRDALGVIVQPRNGQARMAVGHWDGVAGPGLAGRLETWRGHFSRGSLSGSLPYDLRTELQDEPARAVPLVAARLIDRRSLRMSPVEKQAVTELIASYWSPALDGKASEAACMDVLSDELYVARWLAGHPSPLTRGESDSEGGNG